MTSGNAPRLRSDYPRGSAPWVYRLSHWRALGYTDEELERPKIAIVNSSSDLAICFAHLDSIVPKLKKAIHGAGGLALEVRTAAPSDFITGVGRGGRYILPTRDLIVSDIEVAVEGAMLDGMVCLASCDKTTPAQLMAAARLDIPTIIVPCGYQSSGRYCDAHLDIEDVFLNSGRVRSGQVTLDELEAMAKVAVTSPGVCSGMGTANTMHIAAEVLGMALPGSAPVKANSERMWETVERSGRRIVEMIAEDLRPRQILTEAAFKNAVTVVLSASGSINAVKHLQAVAVEAGCAIDVWAEFEEQADHVPLLIGVKPNGEHHIDDFERAGGALALMHELSPLLDLDAPTVSGRRGEVLEGAAPSDREVIRPFDNPLGGEPTILIVRGSLAPSGAIVKRAVVDTRPKHFVGEAIIFHTREDAIAALEAGEIRPGHVVVLRGLGPKGAPGMAFVSGFVFALEGSGLAPQVAVVTDAQLSGLVNKGLVVGEVAPEAAAGGPIGLVEQGDTISIDLDRRTVDLGVEPEVLASREPNLPRPDCRRSYLNVYAHAVDRPERGLVLAAELDPPSASAHP
jgi:dihydroxy-acid dehydratase